MKIVTSYKLRVTSYKLRTVILTLLLSYALPVLNAQIEIKELKLTPEMEKMVITEIQNLPEKNYSEYGITDSLQLENLHFGKPIPMYSLVSEKLEFVSTWSVPRMSDRDSLSLRFSNSWIVPVMSDEAPLLFGALSFSSCKGEERPSIGIYSRIKKMEHFHNYKYKDSIIGSVLLASPRQVMDHLIIRKDNQDIFVQIYDEVTDEYFKNEYRFSELFNHLKKLHLREKEARNRYYEKVANKSELELTPEITEMVVTQVYSSHVNDSDESLSNYGIKDRSQLEHLHLGKPIPRYRIVDEKLTFTGSWKVPVMSDGEPLFLTRVQLEDDGQYRWTGSGAMSEIIHNYEHKDLIVGFLGLRYDSDFLIIRRDNKDICVQGYDYATREYLKNEYSLSEIITAHAQIGKTELKLTPVIEEMVAKKIKNLPEENYSEYGITDRLQLENLHVGKPIPRYLIVNKKSEPIYSFFNMHYYDDEPLSLEFTKNWMVPVMSNEAPLSFEVTVFLEAGSPFVCYINSEIKNTIARFNHYEHKDSIKGFVSLTPYQHEIDYLMIRKENQEIFVEIYDKVTGEYFKNEYSFSELTNYLKEAKMNYYDKVATKSELIITPEITEMLDSTRFSFLRNCSDKILSDCDIKDRSQLENFYFGKPIPMYTIANENLTFTGFWEVTAMSEGEPFWVLHVKLDDDGQYRWAGDGYNPLAKIIHNYEHKDLIIGLLQVRYGWGYLMIRKDNQDIFVQMYDDETREYLKNEYSFSEVLNLLKK